jgi:membrane complex biogenesis BtpA family protein
MRAAIERATQDAHALARAGFDGVIIENFGDAPFIKDDVPAVTVAAMTACALAVREAAPTLALGINVLRNDALAALSIAAATGASFVRVNVLSGARLTDQGIIEGRAADVMRLRAALAKNVRVFADVDVKHSAPLAARAVNLEQEVAELTERALADAVLVTGPSTGSPALVDDIDRVRRATRAPVLVASGVTERTVRDLLEKCDGVIVGTAIKRGRRAGGPVDAAHAKAFVRASTR